MASSDSVLFALLLAAEPDIQDPLRQYRPGWAIVAELGVQTLLRLYLPNCAVITKPCVQGLLRFSGLYGREGSSATAAVMSLFEHDVLAFLLSGASISLVSFSSSSQTATSLPQTLRFGRALLLHPCSSPRFPGF